MDEPESPKQPIGLFRQLQHRWADISDELDDHMQCLQEAERANGRSEFDALERAKRRFGSRQLVVSWLWLDLVGKLVMTKRDILAAAAFMSTGYVILGWMAWSSASENRQMNQLLLQQLVQTRETEASPGPPLVASVLPDKETVSQIASLIEQAHTDLKRRLSDLNKKTMDFRSRNPDIIFLRDGSRDPYAEQFFSVLQKITDLELQYKQLEVLIGHVNEARESGRPDAVIYQMLARNSEGLLSPSEVVQDPISIHLDALNEELENLSSQGKSLEETAERLKGQSRKLQASLAEHRIYEADRAAINTLMTAYQEKLQELDLMKHASVEAAAVPGQ